MSLIDCSPGDGRPLWPHASATQNDPHSPQQNSSSLTGKERQSSSFSIEKLRASVERSQLIAPPLVSERHLPIGFVREGRFTLRPIWHPDSEVLRRIDIHRAERHRTHCPDLVQSTDPEGDYPRCALCQLAVQRDDWQLERRAQILIYAYLYQVEPACRYWKPGKPLLVIGQLEFGQAYCAMLEKLLATTPEVALAMVNPYVSGPGMTLEVHKRSQDRFSMVPLTTEYLPPVELGEWYQPLERCVIRPGFNLHDYETCLMAARGYFLGKE